MLDQGGQVGINSERAANSVEINANPTNDEYPLEFASNARNFLFKYGINLF